MQWDSLIRQHLNIGDTLKNPGGGYSTITSIESNKISYVRGKSTITLPYSALEQAYRNFKGQRCYTYDLKNMNPTVFDSQRSGHSCNCTFLFMIFKEMGLLKGGINGSGVKGSPFYVLIKNPDANSYKNFNVTYDRYNQIIKKDSYSDIARTFLETIDSIITHPVVVVLITILVGIFILERLFNVQ